ncbi:MAG: ABC transporter substrate-binding protein [Desulfobacterales bacterium]|nr:ABC transporter substrate-binding protein [Desulfobacterales bacterium]
MIRRNFIIMVCIAVFLFSTASGHCEKPSIAWFQSDKITGFWPMVERFILAASEDLGVEVRIYTYGENPMLIVPKVEAVLSDPDSPPDAILFHNFKKKGKQVLQLSEKYKVPAFVFNAGFDESENVGRPREKYAYWIGQMLPDDEYAGFLLAKKLMVATKKLNKRGKDGKFHVVALEGNRASEASNLRVKGFKSALENEEGSEFVTHQFFHSKWREKLAFDAFKLSRLRYPEVSMFWTASDSMAIGVIKGAADSGWVPGRDFVTGGVDILPQNQDYLKSGQMAVSVGGHYVEGAWAVIALYDYLKGYDFKELGSTMFATKMGHHESATFTKFGDLRHRLSKENIGKIDFTRFSRAYNPGLTAYNFEFESLFD